MRTSRLLSCIATAVLALAAACATASASALHTVRRGETLSSIAATDGLSVSQLAAANGLSSGAVLSTGRALIIPARGAVPAAAPATEATSAAATPVGDDAAAPAGSGVVVARGETLSGIAAQYGTTAAALAAANGMSENGLLLAGRTLTVPGAAASADTPSPVAASPAAAPATTDQNAGAEPVAAFVTPSQVGEIAAADDVSPALAEAIADQESGFNDDEVSRTGATGVMQIEPGTWRALTREGGLALASDSPTDNVRGGVALLHGLLAQTGGDESEAIAAYYQGLASVRSAGMYPSTRRYVRSVLALQGRY